MEVTHGRGYVYSIQYHIVWCVKYRHKILYSKIEKRLMEILNMVATYECFQVLVCNIRQRPRSFVNQLFTTTLYSQHSPKNERNVFSDTYVRIWRNIKEDTMGWALMESFIFCGNSIRKYRRTN